MQPGELPAAQPKVAWYREMSRYHWFVFVVAALGWLFDTMDQQIFAMTRSPAIAELAKGASIQEQKDYAGLVTSIFIIGWATGGLIFGVLSDRFGRAKMLLITILLYSLFTGVSAFSVGIWDYALWRFLTGLGVGGEFAVGVALIAESLPERARPHALGWLQALSTVGNVTAGFIVLGIGALARNSGLPFELTVWRAAFLVGTLPALLAIVIRWRLKEPERWTAIAASEQVRKKMGSLKELFGHPTWKKHAILGLILASSGVIGLWGIVFFAFDFIQDLFKPQYVAQGLEGVALRGKLIDLVFYTGLLLNFGGFLGMYTVSRVTQIWGRKRTFAVSFVISVLSVAATFWFLSELWHLYVLIPLLGFCIFSLFAGYAIYLPELFPTALRGTGTSFCYNVGRYIAAIGPLTLGKLLSSVYGSYGQIESWRYSGVTMSLFLLIGLCVLPLLPETKDQPLPE